MNSNPLLTKLRGYLSRSLFFTISIWMPKTFILMSRHKTCIHHLVQDQHTEMRSRIVVELVVHEHFYLSDKMSVVVAQHSDFFQVEKLTPEAVQKLYRREVQHVTKPGTYMGMWQMQAVASVLQTSLQSVYPEYGGYTVRPHYHRVLHARTMDCRATEGSSTKTPDCIPGIMWTRVMGKDKPPTGWLPNHFVACLPSRRPHVGRKRQASHDNDIRSFFAKRPKLNNFVL